MSDGVTVSVEDLLALRQSARGLALHAGRKLSHLMQGRHASAIRGRGLQFEEIRRYLPGDDVRQIDWRVTARNRKTHIRVYSEERERPVFLVVDCGPNMFFASQEKMKSVLAAEIAALLGWAAIDHGDRIGAVIIREQDIISLPPARSSTAAIRLCRELAAATTALAGSRPSDRQLHFNDGLQALQHLVQHDALLVYITDGQDADAETRQRITQLARRNDCLLFFLSDPLEEALPDHGRIVLGDGRQQLEVASNDAGLRQRFHEDFLKRRQRGRDWLLTRAIPLFAMSTVGDTASQLRRQLLGRPGPHQQESMPEP